MSRAKASNTRPVLTSSEDVSHGINVCGYLRDESGWGAAGRGYVRALRALGLPIALGDFSDLSSNRSEDDSVQTSDLTFPYDLNLVCIDPTQHYALVSAVGPEFFDRRYTIGAWAWELPRFPDKWRDRFAFYDELWVTTSFVANALAPYAPIPVVRIPPVLTPRGDASRTRGRNHLHVSEDEFVFLFIFDFHSHLARKNPLAAITAFQHAFASTTGARLVCKCVNAQADPEGYAQMRALARDNRITIYDGYWSASEMRDLMAGCDAYVSLHRSEGTGLTITDALALGKPVIATGWSGNMDFMSVANSFPVRYELVELRENVGPYRAGEVWAEPSVDDAAKWMRFVFENRGDANARGARGAREIAANYSPESIAKLIAERLAAIQLRRQLNKFRANTWASFRKYQQLGSTLRSIVERVVPPDATLLVVSKGDEELVKFDRRTASHFPETESGIYLGYHPADSAAAIAYLETARANGGDYLLVPHTAFWWLDHYGEFACRLEECYARIWQDEHCILYDLRTIET